MVTGRDIPVSLVSNLIWEKYGLPFSEVHVLAEGVFSRAYAFHAAGRDLVIRVGSSIRGFMKDDWAYRHLSPGGIPIPETLAQGKINDQAFFCISQRIPGTTLDKTRGWAEERSIARSLVDIIWKLSSLPVPEGTGFGTLSGSGQGSFPSWRSFLTCFQGWPDMIHHGVSETLLDFDALFERSFLDRKVVDSCIREIRAWAPCCPDSPHFVHGDLGFGNCVTDGSSITGVLDWAELLCGDFLVDVAAQDFGRGDTLYSDLFLESAKERDIPLPHFRERLRCYQLLMGLKSIFLEANRGQEEWYREDCAKLARLGIG
jgi:hygromycin-B 4-O-kinase